MNISVILRLLLIMIILIIAISVLGCNYVDQPVLEERVEVHFWYGLGGALGDAVETLIDDFNLSQQEVLVIGHQQGNYYETFDSLEIAIATNTPPDCALLEHRDIISLISRDALAPIDEFISSDSSVQTNDIPKQFLDVYINDNNLYSLPMYGSVWISYFRNDFLSKLNLRTEDIETWQELMVILSDVRENSPKDGNIPVWEMINDQTTLINTALGNGGKFLSDDQTEVLINSSEWVEVWDQFRKWIYEEKLIKLYKGNVGWDDYYTVVNNVMVGRAVGYVGSNGDLGILDHEKLRTSLHLKWEGGYSKPISNSIGIVIPYNVNEEKKKASYQWMSYLLSPEVSAKWSILSGYLPATKTAVLSSTFQEYTKEHQEFLVSVRQLESSSMPFKDPTGGLINEAIEEAAYRVLNENVLADIALNEAKEKAQKALDEYRNQ